MNTPSMPAEGARMRTYTGSLLLVRSALLTSVIVALAAGAHVIGGGNLPDGGILAALAAVVLVPVAALSRRRLGPASAALALGLGQVLLHTAFAALAASDPCTPGADDLAGHSGHSGHSDAPLLHCMPAVSHAAFGVAVADATMTLAHAAAVLVTAALVSGGDRALALLIAWLRPLITLLAVALPVTAAPRRSGFDVDRPVLPRPTGRPCSRRGPPSRIAAPA